jgi:hypothetical protein
MNPNITLEIVQNNPDEPWDWHGISKNPNITWEIVQKHPEKPWCWYELSKNPNITWEIVQKHPEKPWVWSGISINPNITWDIVEKHPDNPWNWGELSYNKMNVAREIFMKNQLFQKYTEWFVKSDLKRELMENRRHPRNLDKWCGWGFNDEVDDMSHQHFVHSY